MAIDLHCPYIRKGRNEAIHLVGSSDEAMWLRQGTFGRMLERTTGGPLKFKAGDSIPFGTGWNTASTYAQGRNCSRWAASIDGIDLATTIEIPYANVGDETVTPDNARAFGRSLAKAMRLYLEHLATAQD